MLGNIVTVLCFTCVFGSVIRVSTKQESVSLLTLPSNATSIRDDISDTFNCTDREYGYYADVDNGCQIFHVCLPVTFSGGRNATYRWSFICPESTIFNQEILTCTREDDSINCEESPMFYNVNSNFGIKEDEAVEEDQADKLIQEEGLESPQQDISLKKSVEKTTFEPIQQRDMRRRGKVL